MIRSYLKASLLSKKVISSILILSGTSVLFLNPSNAYETERCNSAGWCIAKRGYDFLGTPKIVGWSYKEYPVKREVRYYEREPLKVKVRGSYGRYIQARRISRRYKQMKPGTPPNVSVIGSASTDCYDTGYSISCTTTQPDIITSAGTPTLPAGVYEIYSNYIIDCQDKTYESNTNMEYYQKNKKTKWRSFIPRSKGGNWFAYDKAMEYCGSVNSLKRSDFRRYE